MEQATKEPTPAERVRAAFKREGWTSRDVTVKHNRFSGGSSLDATIRSTRPTGRRVLEILREEEHVRRCEYSGDILAGGNTYVSLRYSDEAKVALGAPYVEALKIAGERIETFGPKEIYQLTSIGETGLYLGWEQHYGHAYAIRGDAVARPSRVGRFAKHPAHLAEAAFLVALILRGDTAL